MKINNIKIFDRKVQQRFNTGKVCTSPVQNKSGSDVFVKTVTFGKVDQPLNEANSKLLAEILAAYGLKPTGDTRLDLAKIKEASAFMLESTNYVLERSNEKPHDSITDNLEDIVLYANLCSNSVEKILDFLGVPPTDSVKNNLTKMYNYARTDKLSGLNNKRALFADLQKHINELRGKNIPLTIAMFDMDNFKAVNDLLGYSIGDKFIQIIGTELDKVAKKHKFETYRFGGEEFLILMPGVNQEESLPIVEEIVHAINGNKEMDSHLPTYKKEGERIIESLAKKQERFKEVKRLMHNIKLAEKIAHEHKNELESSGAVLTFVNNIANSTIAELHEKSLKLLEHAKEVATGKTNKEFIQRYIDRVKNHEPFDKIFEGDKDIQAYLYTVYDNNAKIALIHKWLSRTEFPDETGKPQGFSITAGIKEFKDFDKPVESYIQETGKVLSYGKRHIKGKVYTKTPEHYVVVDEESI